MNTQNKLTIVCLLAGLAFAPVLEAAAPVVTNVRAAQRTGTKFVDLLYDVADIDGGPLTITVAVSDNAGTNYTVPASSFLGDVGTNVSPGLNKQIVWNAGMDWNQRLSTTMRFKVTASDLPATVVAPEGMVLIPAGTFTMGDSSGDNISGASPRSVTITKAFCMDIYPVTKALWDSVAIPANQRGYSFSIGSGLGKGPNHPVQTVGWYDAIKWCNARSQQEGRLPVYYTDWALTTFYKSGNTIPNVNGNANGYRLPSSAEWEYAARGGLTGKRFPWGNTIAHSLANYNSTASFAYDASPTIGYHPAYNDGTKPYTNPVGSFAPNGYGLYDIVGNVLQYCWDITSNHSGNYTYSQCIVRGGSWDLDADSCRSAASTSDVVFTIYDYDTAAKTYNNNRYNNTGFRCVLTPGQ